MRLQNISCSILFFLTFTSTNAFAQTVILSCEKKLTKEFLENHPKTWEEQCTKSAGNSCALVQEARNEVKLCEGSKLPYSHKREFTFDKKALNDRNESWAETVALTCFGVNRTSRSKVIATATVISFVQGEYAFNVDRATLNGGWRELRDWQCDVKEKRLENKI